MDGLLRTLTALEAPKIHIAVRKPSLVFRVALGVEVEDLYGAGD